MMTIGNHARRHGAHQQSDHEETSNCNFFFFHIMCVHKSRLRSRKGNQMLTCISSSGLPAVSNQKVLLREH